MDHISGLYCHSFHITIFLIFQQMNNIGADLIDRFITLQVVQTIPTNVTISKDSDIIYYDVL